MAHARLDIPLPADWPLSSTEASAHVGRWEETACSYSLEASLEVEEKAAHGLHRKVEVAEASQLFPHRLLPMPVPRRRRHLCAWRRRLRPAARSPGCAPVAAACRPRAENRAHSDFGFLSTGVRPLLGFSAKRREGYPTTTSTSFTKLFDRFRFLVCILYRFSFLLLQREIYCAL